MAYFENNGRRLGGNGPQANGRGAGEYFSTAGLGGNATGEYFAAMNGMGQIAANSQNMAPQQLSPALPHGSRAWREGILGERQAPARFGRSLYPWKEGILGPSLGQNDAQAERSNPDTLDLRNPAIIDDLKKILNLLADYTFVQNGWGQNESVAYVKYIDANSPLYEDKSELKLVVGGITYPTARGAYILAELAYLEWDATESDAEQRMALTYPALYAWFLAYEENMSGGTIAPVFVTATAPEPAKASMIAIAGVGAVAVALGVIMFGQAEKKPMRSNPRRRRRRRMTRRR